MIPKHDNRTGNILPCPQYYGRFSSGSTAGFSLKIAPKHDTKIYYLSIPAVTAKMGGFSLRRHYAENVKKVEERACFLPE